MGKEIISVNAMQGRLVKYRELRPCTTAFIDSRTPGSDTKENFTIIGPGVAENPDQFVHITVPHGFNIGGARQPPGCVNSQHSHETAEVFIVHTGIWRFKTGANANDGYVDLVPGDTISIPVRTFRGFENVGKDIGFMFAVLGGDDPGHVIWAPYVFEQAATHGMVLLEGGRLIDTSKEAVPPGAARLQPTTLADLDRFTHYDSAALARCVVKASDLRPAGGLSNGAGIEECPIVGTVSLSERMPAAPLAWSHGFQVRALRFAPAAASPWHRRDEEEVLLVHAGVIRFDWAGGTMTLGPGDTFTVPKTIARRFSNETAGIAVAYVVRGGDHPAGPRPIDAPSAT